MQDAAARKRLAVAKNKADKTAKVKSDGQELKSHLAKAASKLTESKGWSQKMTDNGTPLALQYSVAVANVLSCKVL